MKTAYLLLAMMAIVISGCEQKADVEPNQTDVSFDKDLETFVNSVVEGGGYTIGGAGRDGMKTIGEVANIKLLYANYKSSQKLQTAIEEFNKSSTALANKMLYLTIVIAILTGVMAALTLVMGFKTVVQVAKSIEQFVVWMYKKGRSLAQSYMKRFAKTERSKKSPVKQCEHNNKSKSKTRNSGSIKKPPDL